MPDRDYLPSSVPKGWHRAAKLWKHDGFSDELVVLARQALAATLRERVMRGGLDVTRLAEVVEGEVRANLLGPLRAFRLRVQSIAEVDADERRMITSLLPDAAWYGQQLQHGRRLTARPTRRRPPERVLRDAVSISLPGQP